MCIRDRTLSGKLSGSYNSAELGKNLFEEEHPGEKKIYVFNSRSASVGETPVSYTHLDVYKRQVCTFDVKNALSIIHDNRMFAECAFYCMKSSQKFK